MSSPLFVCVVDDDPSLCAALVNLLRSCGYRATAHGSAEDFLASADLAGADCVVTDIQMPGLSGIDLRLALAGRRPGLPVILMTARTERALLDRATAVRPFRLLHKPFDAEELATCLAEAIGPAEGAVRP
ncbi:response regulator [Niveispirillum sp.]|uniref:response regulator transcription factor n=1 Tax=Niveispirillum sp. TaxID=1917217 RepID=UPI001B438AE0|nr:response regulator [Niveispirillum sp.]MBP7338950.1 response regulator [Niveispirillum sp.]